jgi:hypothetical protein
MKVRLALREEGPSWNAYMALPDTMKDAKLIGSIAMGAVRKNPEIKDGFMKLMQMVLADAVEAVTGEAPEAWDIGPAPEAERAGHS